MVIGETRTGYYLLHVTRERLEFPDLKRKAIALGEIWSPQFLLIEDAASGQALIQALRSENNLPVLSYKVGGTDKLARAVACSLLIESGRLFIPEASHWLREFLDEVTAFPAAPHDDQVDALSMGLNYLRENRWERPILTLAPSTSRWSMPDPRQFRDSCAESDAIEDGTFGWRDDIYIRTNKSRFGRLYWVRKPGGLVVGLSLHLARRASPEKGHAGESNRLESQDRQRDKLVSCLFVGLYYVVVDLGEKGRVKAIGDLGKTDVEADFDDLWDGKILRQGLIRGVVDRQQLRGLLSVSNNGRLSLAVDASGQRVITQVPQLFFAD